MIDNKMIIKKVSGNGYRVVYRVLYGGTNYPTPLLSPF